MAWYRLPIVSRGPGVQGVAAFMCTVDQGFSNLNVHRISGGSCENAPLIQDTWGGAETL